jgi:foldase protein PrsA
MTRFRISLLSLLVAAVALSAGCGGGGSSTGLQKGDIAVVGDRHITQSELDHQVKLKLASAKVDKQTVPAAGTAAYQSQVVDPVVQRLVTEAQVENIAAVLKITVSDTDVQKALDAAVKAQFGTDLTKYHAFLTKYSITEQDIKDQVIRPSLLQTKIQDKVKAMYPITDAQILSYYNSHKTSFITPDSRQLHYLIAASKADATAAHTALAGGAAWGPVYKKYSIDYEASATTPVAQLGQFSALKGQTEVNFGTAVFGTSLKNGQLSGLIEVTKSYADRTFAGKCKPTCYFVIKPDASVVKGGSRTLAQVKASIESTLASTVQTPAVSKKLQALLDAQKKLTKYAKGYAPPTPTNPGTTGGGTT